MIDTKKRSTTLHGHARLEVVVVFSEKFGVSINLFIALHWNVFALVSDNFSCEEFTFVFF